MLNLKNKKVLIMGLGRFGGGVGATRYAVSQGARVCVTDLLNAGALTQSLSQLADLEVEYHLGSHRPDDFSQADIVIVNPAVDSKRNAYLQIARNAGAILTTAMRLLISALPGRAQVIGITGSAGKSTTTAMIGHIFKDYFEGKKRRVWIGGNLGGSLLPQVHCIAPQDPVVLELSSFMLEELAQDQWSPHIAILTSFGANHLDRHGDLFHYQQAKQVIFEYQTAEDLAILPKAIKWPYALRGQIQRFGKTLPPGLTLQIPGDHNRANALAALAACAAWGVDPAQARQSLGTFPGLPHRLQWVGVGHRVRYFNDSKSTTPAAAMRAIDCFERGCVHVILGGYDKQVDLKPLAEHAAGVCRAIYTFGQTGNMIAQAACSGPATVRRCVNLEEATEQAARAARPGDVVLLSPGCASWDQFDHFEQRGDLFVQIITRLARQADA